MTWVVLGILAQASHNSLMEYCPTPPDRTGVTESGSQAAFLHMPFHLCLQIFCGIEIKAWGGHSKTLTWLSLRHFVTHLGVCLG